MIAFDTETGLIMPGDLTPPLVCVQLASDEPFPEHIGGLTKAYTSLGLWAGIWTWREAPRALNWMFQTGQKIITHNGAYDVGVILKEYPDLAPVIVEAAERIDGWHDTLIAEMLRDIAGPGEISQKKGRYTLAGLVDQYLDEHVTGKEAVGDEDPWRLRYMELALVPLSEWPQEAIDYALLDPVYTLRVAQRQPHLVNVEAQVRGSIGLHLCATVGPRTNPARVKAFEEAAKAGVETAAEVGRKVGILRTEYKKNLDVIRGALGDSVRKGKNGLPLTNDKALREAGGELEEWVDLGGMKTPAGIDFGVERGFVVVKEVETKAILQEMTLKAYGARGKHPGFTDSGDIRTDKDTLMASEDPVLIAYAEGSVHRTSLSRYAPQLWLGTEHDMTSRPRPIVASGRAAWSEPNMHNPPRKGGFREAFEPRPGHVYGMCDWSAAELRSWSQICIWLFGFSKMAEAFRDGKDPHTILAATLRHVSYEEAVALKKAGDLPERKVAKAGNFGFLGGMGAATFVDYCTNSGLQITLEEAQDIREAFARAWPESVRYFEWIDRVVLTERNGIATQFVSGRQRGGLGYCDACNTFFQGLTADYAKSALWAAWRESLLGVRWDAPGIPSPMKGVRIWLLLHDEIIVEGPEETSAEWGDRLRDLMVEVASAYTPDVPQVAEVALSRVWSKQAEEVRDDTGRLLPWSPKEESCH